MLRAEAQRNHTFTDNLGVGDFDLPERGYSQTRNESVLRGSIAGSIRKSMFNEFRAQWRTEDARVRSDSRPAGRARPERVQYRRRADRRQRAACTTSWSPTISTSRSGVTRSGRACNSKAAATTPTIRRNAGGTFTFAGLDAFNAGAPTTFTRNVGDPLVDVTQVQAGLYIQDDFRARKDLTISGGVRQEIQSHIGGFHLAPRGGIAWSPFKSGKTTVRGGAGSSSTGSTRRPTSRPCSSTARTSRSKRSCSPAIPNPTVGGQAQRLPPGRVQLAHDLEQPRTARSDAPASSSSCRATCDCKAMYIHRQRRQHPARGVNINAPRRRMAGGRIRRRDRSTEIESVGLVTFDALSLNFNYMKPAAAVLPRGELHVRRSVNETDSAFEPAGRQLQPGGRAGPVAATTRGTAS